MKKVWRKYVAQWKDALDDFEWFALFTGLHIVAAALLPVALPALIILGLFLLGCKAAQVGIRALVNRRRKQ